MTPRRWAAALAIYAALQVAALFILPWLAPFTFALVARVLERLG